MKAIKIIFVILITLAFFKVCYDNFAADVCYKLAQGYIDEFDLPTAMTYAETAIKLNPLEPNYYRMRARIFINYLPGKEEGAQKVIKELIVKDLGTAYSLNPQNLVTIRNLVPLYYFVATKSVTEQAGPENIDPTFFAVTKSYYASIKDYSPNDVGVYALVAKYEKRLNMMDEYNASVAKVRDLRPDLLDWYDSFK